MNIPALVRTSCMVCHILTTLLMNSIIDMLWGARWMTNASSAFRAVRSRTTLHLTCQGKYTMM